jgi:hypothetical protein
VTLNGRELGRNPTPETAPRSCDARSRGSNRGPEPLCFLTRGIPELPGVLNCGQTSGVLAL